MKHRTAKGVDESFLGRTEDGYTRHKYLNGVVLKGGKYGVKILDEIAERLNNNKSIVINVTGPPGSGKTYFAMAFAQLYDPNFTIIDTPAPPPNEDTSSMAFEREHIAYLVGDSTPLKRGQAVVVDEAHFGLGSRSYQNVKQIEIVNLVAALRSKGFMVIIVTLHSTMLDKIPREHVVNYEFSMRDRGLAKICLLYTSPSPRDRTRSRMPSSA